MPGPEEERPLWKKLGWFAVLWAGGVVTVAAVAYVLKLTIGA